MTSLQCQETISSNSEHSESSDNAFNIGLSNRLREHVYLNLFQHKG